MSHVCSLLDILRRLPPDLPTPFQDGMGLKLSLRFPVDMTHAGYLASSLHTTENPAGGPEVQILKTVPLMLEDFSQFSILGESRVAFLIASGPKADSFLQSAIQAEARYDPAMFDSDGYALEGRND